MGLVFFIFGGSDDGMGFYLYFLPFYLLLCILGDEALQVEKVGVGDILTSLALMIFYFRISFVFQK